MNIQQTFQLALQHHQTGRLPEAETLYRQILAAEPRHADALHLLGVMMQDAGRSDAAVDLIRQAIALNPRDANYHYNLGEAHRTAGQFEEAVSAYRQAIAIEYRDPEAHNSLGIALYETAQLEAAIAAYRQAIVLRPNYPQAFSNLGNALRTAGKPEEAIVACRHAIALKPDYAIAYGNLALGLCDKGQLDESIAASRRAIALNSNYPDAHAILGVAFQACGQLEDAIAANRRAIALNQDYAEAHFNLSNALLGQGHFAIGWETYEWRWKCRRIASFQRDFAQPKWDGKPLKGRTILLHAEQGFGDAIHFIRYLPLVIQRGGRVVLECQSELHRLFQTMAPDLPVVPKGRALPDFDVHCPLLSLPRLFATDFTNIPSTIPYLRADETTSEIWRDRLRDDPLTAKVGLSWAGSPTNLNDRNRSLALSAFAPLAQVAGVRFVSLQKGDAAAEAKSPPEGMELLDAGQELKDFADTAALVAALDLVIAVDTSVVHLAGAMGKPVWVLLPFAPDWRWLLNRDDSPWYPTMRLFRQQRRVEWEPVIAQVHEQLQSLVASRR